ncbi:MAG: PepSY domain-containing protein [Simplicispira sp.]|nr:PepSY domain-containing protein [Simplicispira sp.]
MKYLPSLRHGLLVLSLGLAALPTRAGDDCDAPVPRWQTREALRQWAAAQGWQVQRLKIDDGCYEIRGTDAQGHSFKAKIDPETLTVLKRKQVDPQRARERDRDRERNHDGEGAARHTRPLPGGTAGPAPLPSPLSAPGTAPRGQTE